MRLLAAVTICCLLVVCLSATMLKACTSFCLETPDGIYFGTNLDLMTGDGHLFVNRRGIAKEGYKASTKGEVARWVSRYGNVTFNLVGRELAWGGMNEAGPVGE